MELSRFSRRPQSKKGESRVRVRVYCCRGALESLAQPTTSASEVAPQSLFPERETEARAETTKGVASYVVLHTDLDRGTTSVAPESLEPQFFEEFWFRCRPPAKEALVVRLMRSLSSHERSYQEISHHRDRKGNQMCQDELIGTCVVSLESLVCCEERLNWVPLVRKAGTKEAFMQGEILLSLYTEDFTAATSPSVDSTLPYEIHETLLRHAPEELHRLDWLTGHYTQFPDRWPRRRAAYEKKAQALRLRTTGGISASPGTAKGAKGPGGAQASVRVNILIKKVEHLIDEYGYPTLKEACCVGVAAEHGSGEVSTQFEPFAQSGFHFRQDFFLHLKSFDERVRFQVKGKDGELLGETTYALFNLHPQRPTPVVLGLMGLTKECLPLPPSASQRAMIETRAHCPPQGSGRTETSAIEEVLGGVGIGLRGYLHVVVYAEAFSSLVHFTPKEAEMLHRRVMAYLWFQCREELHQVYPILSRMCNVERGMQELTAAAGPELTPVRMRAHFLGCSGLTGVLAAEQAQCVLEIRVGPLRYRSKPLITQGRGILNIQETFDLIVYNPYSTPCTVILMALPRKSTSAWVEVGRVTFGFGKMMRVGAGNSSMSRDLPLTYGAFTEKAGQNGARVRFEVEAIDPHFGYDATHLPEPYTPQSQMVEESYSLSRVEVALLRSQPAHLHAAAYFLDCSGPGGASRLVDHLHASHEEMVREAPMEITVLGVRNLRKPCRFQVKVEMNGETVLKTRGKQAKDAKSSMLSFPDDNTKVCTVSPSSATGLVVTVRVFEGLLTSTPVPLGEPLQIAFHSLLRGEKNVLWLPVYPKIETPEKKASPFIKHNIIPLGFVGLSLVSNAFPRNRVAVLLRREKSLLTPQEEVLRDVSTLLLHFQPKELPNVHLWVSKYPSLELAHREIRKQLVPFPCAATLFFTIDRIVMGTEEGAQQEQRGRVAVRLRCGNVVRTSRCRRETALGSPGDRSAFLFYPILRMDVPLQSVGLPPFASPSSTNAAGSRPPVLGKPWEGPTGSSRAEENRGGHAGQTSSSPTGGGVPPAPASSLVVPPLFIELVGLSRMGKTESDRWLEEDSDSDENDKEKMERTQQQQASAYAALVKEREHWEGGKSADVNRLSTYQAGGSSHYGKPLPPAPYFPDTTLGEAKISVRGLLTPGLYNMGDAITLPIVATTPYTQRPGGNGSTVVQKVVGHVGSITFRVMPSAFEEGTYPPLLRVDVPPPKVNAPPFDPEAIRYYSHRILTRLQAIGASSLVNYHYLLHEHYVASGTWDRSLQEWLKSLQVPRLGR